MTTSRFSGVCLLLVFCCHLAFVSPARAQSESGAAAVEGRVVDAAGAAAPLVPVTLTLPDTGYSRTVSTDADGRFVARAMPVGTYTIEARLPGSVARLQGVTLRVGATMTVTLKSGDVRVSEAVNVSSEAPTIDVATAAGSTGIPIKAIDELPIRGRNFVEFVQLTPAIMQESDRSGVVISGQRSINSNVSIDGADFNDPLQGNQRGGNETTFFFPQAAVQEFQVVRSGANAEIGRTSAGFVNVVTKSGTNTRRGDLFYFNRNRRLTSRDAFGQKLNNSQNQFGASVGGPILPSKAFFFAALEQNLVRVPFVVKFQQQAANVVVPDELKAQEGEKFGTNNPTALFTRTDWSLSPAHSLNIQYTFSRLRGRNFNFDSPQQDAAESTNYTRHNVSNGLKTQLQSVLSPAMINEVRAQVATDNRNEEPNSTAPGINITNFGTLGGDVGRPRVFRNTRYQATDNLTWMFGRHEARIGVDVNITSAEQMRESNTPGRIDYSNVNNYVNNVINRYRQTVPGFDPADLLYAGTQKEAGVFVQDKLTFNTVTISLGLRWDGQWNPTPPRPNPKYPVTSKIPNDLSMWQPRAGFSWNVGGTGTTVVRLSTGYYAARTPANLFQRVFTDNGYSVVAVDSRTDATVLPLISRSQGLTSLPAGMKVPPQRIFGFDPNFQNPRTIQSALSLDHQLARGVTVSAGYIFAKTKHLQRRLDRNLGTPTYNAVGMPIYPTTRPDPTIAQLEVNESTARSLYHAAVLTGALRRGRLYSQLNYTYAQNKDDDSNERNFSRELTLNVFNTEAEYTWSKQDIRHSVNWSSVVDLSGGVSFGAIVIARTGVPYTAVTGSDTQNDGNDDNDRAIIDGRVTARNEFRQPNFFDLDLRLQKRLSLARGRAVELTLEVFNATRASNKHFGNDAVSVYGTGATPAVTAGQPLFAPSTARFGGPRQVQLGLRFNF